METAYLKQIESLIEKARDQQIERQLEDFSTKLDQQLQLLEANTPIILGGAQFSSSEIAASIKQAFATQERQKLEGELFHKVMNALEVAPANMDSLSAIQIEELPVSKQEEVIAKVQEEEERLNSVEEAAPQVIGLDTVAEAPKAIEEPEPVQEEKVEIEPKLDISHEILGKTQEEEVLVEIEPPLEDEDDIAYPSFEKLASSMSVDSDIAAKLVEEKHLALSEQEEEAEEKEIEAQEDAYISPDSLESRIEEMKSEEDEVVITEKIIVEETPLEPELSIKKEEPAEEHEYTDIEERKSISNEESLEDVLAEIAATRERIFNNADEGMIKELEEKESSGEEGDNGAGEERGKPSTIGNAILANGKEGTSEEESSSDIRETFKNPFRFRRDQNGRED